VVGHAAIDMICAAFDGADIDREIITPAEVLTATTLPASPARTASGG
jgi:hypothetical protein